MRTKTAHYIQIVCLIIGLIACLLSYAFESVILVIVAGVMLLLGNTVWLIFGKCPHCGRHFWKHYPKFCPHCGAKTE